MKPVHYSILFLMAGLSACVSLPKSYQTKDEVVSVATGPEDMVVDSITESPRLLLSCSSRRKHEPDYGEIQAYYTETGALKVLKRIGEPVGLSFNPHGIDLVQVNGELVLLVVNHEHLIKVNSILRYKVLKDELLFKDKIVDPLISSPNAVTGFADGAFLVSNDAKKAGNIWEVLFKLRKALVVYYDGRQCSVASGKYAYTNGITNRNGKVYLASTMQNKVWQFDFAEGKMLNRKVIGKAKGADNLRFDGEDILVAAHLRFLKFLKHYKDSSKPSPSTVYRINPTTCKTTVVYYDDGKQISAASTALVFRNNLYVSGIFDGKLVKKPVR
ncbi:MAG: hypothetical protein IPH78_03100 [Bacteroidetes bacterium]|nr:hypothetical protein [Bacteroidota bacterium]